MKRIVLCWAMLYVSLHGAANSLCGKLRNAVGDGNVAEVQKLLDEGADPNYGDHIPLLCATRAGHADIAAMLLSHGADPYIRDYFGLSPIEAALRSDNQQFMETFFTLTGPLKSDHPTVRLMWIRSAGICLQSEIKKLFFWGKVDPNIQDNTGETALHKAATWGDIDMISLLILLGVNLNIQNNFGNTALHLAASRGHEIACAALLNEGARYDILNIDRKTALTLAIDQGHKEGVRLFRRDCSRLQPRIDASRRKMKDELAAYVYNCSLCK